MGPSPMTEGQKWKGFGQPPQDPRCKEHSKAMDSTEFGGMTKSPGKNSHLFENRVHAGAAVPHVAIAEVP